MVRMSDTPGPFSPHHFTLVIKTKCSLIKRPMNCFPWTLYQTYSDLNKRLPPHLRMILQIKGFSDEK